MKNLKVTFRNSQTTFEAQVCFWGPILCIIRTLQPPETVLRAGKRWNFISTVQLMCKCSILGFTNHKHLSQIYPVYSNNCTETVLPNQHSFIFFERHFYILCTEVHETVEVTAFGICEAKRWCPQMISLFRNWNYGRFWLFHVSLNISQSSIAIHQI